MVARFLKPLWPVAALLLAVVVVKISNSNPLISVNYTLLGASAACLKIVTSDESSFLTRLLSLPPIVALGRISYGFYLSHLPILMVINDQLVAHGTVPAFSLTLVATVASYWLIELPFLRLKFSRFSSVSLLPSGAGISAPPGGGEAVPIRLERTK